MEMGIQSEQLTLHWASCGPDLSAFERVNKLETARLLRQFGEIRVRYAAHLTKNALNSRDPDPALWLRVTVSACDKGLNSTYGMNRTGEVIRHNYRQVSPRWKLPIPWLKLYMPGLTKDEREYVECASVHRGTRHLELLQKFNERIDSAFREQTERVFLQTPDLRMENVLPWLCFIVEGHKDSELNRAHREFQPHESVRDSASYLKAWDTLTRF